MANGVWQRGIGTSRDFWLLPDLRGGPRTTADSCSPMPTTPLQCLLKTSGTRRRLLSLISEIARAATRAFHFIEQKLLSDLFAWVSKLGTAGSFALFVGHVQ